MAENVKLGAARDYPLGTRSAPSRYKTLPATDVDNSHPILNIPFSPSLLVLAFLSRLSLLSLLVLTFVEWLASLRIPILYVCWCSSLDLPSDWISAYRLETRLGAKQVAR